MRWLEVSYEVVFGVHKRLMNFEEDLKNSLYFAAAITNYVGKNCQKLLATMRKVCNSDEDYVYNSEKLF